MGQAFRLAVLSWGCASLLAGGASVARADAPVTVKAPCSERNEPGLRACHALLKGGAGAPGLLERVRQRVTEQIHGDAAATPPVKGYYQNVDPDPLNPPGGFFGPTVCNLVEGPLNPVSEIAHDRSGKSCGNPVQLGVRMSVSKLAGCATGTPSFAVTIDKRWNSADPSASKGTLEDGYLRGGLIQATLCNHAAVAREIETKAALTVSDIDGKPSPCLALARDVSQLSAGMRKTLEGLKKRLDREQAGLINLADIVNCEKNWDEAGSARPGGRPDAGPLRQSAQQLCAARAGIETMFTQLAACEIFARAQIGYQSRMGKSARQQEIFEMIQRKVSAPAAEACQRELERGACNLPSNDQISECVNRHYRKNLPPVLREHIRGLWPSDGSRCEANASPVGSLPGAETLWLLAGSMGMVPFRRRKGRPRASWLKACLVLGLGAFLQSACSKKHTSVAAPDTGDKPAECASLRTEDKECCLRPDPFACNADNQGGGGFAGALAGAADAGGSVVAPALAAAEQLVGETGEVGTGGVLAQGAAASADPGGFIGAGKKPPSELAKNGAPTGAAGSPNRPAPGPGLTLGSGSSGGAFGSGLSTAPSTPPGATDGSASPEAAGDGVSGVYKAGAAASADGSGAAQGFRAGSYGEASGAPSENVVFGDASGGTSVVTAGTTDPEDYFTRLELGDDLFKTVEKRYRAQTIQWSRVDKSDAKE